MSMLSTKTYSAKIYLGLRVGYSTKIYTFKSVEAFIQGYVSEVGWCVTVTKTKFFYKNGCEKGVIVGIINYPRFPMLEDELKKRTLCLARKLLEAFKQNRVSIEFKNETMMIL